MCINMDSTDEEGTGEYERHRANTDGPSDGAPERDNAGRNALRITPDGFYGVLERADVESIGRNISAVDCLGALERADVASNARSNFPVDCLGAVSRATVERNDHRSASADYVDALERADADPTGRQTSWTHYTDALARAAVDPDDIQTSSADYPGALERSDVESEERNTFSSANIDALVRASSESNERNTLASAKADVFELAFSDTHDIQPSSTDFLGALERAEAESSGQHASSAECFGSVERTDVSTNGRGNSPVSNVEELELDAADSKGAVASLDSFYDVVMGGVGRVSRPKIVTESKFTLSNANRSDRHDAREVYRGEPGPVIDVEDSQPLVDWGTVIVSQKQMPPVFGLSDNRRAKFADDVSTQLFRVAGRRGFSGTGNSVRQKGFMGTSIPPPPLKTAEESDKTTQKRPSKRVHAGEGDAIVPRSPQKDTIVGAQKDQSTQPSHGLRAKRGQPVIKTTKTRSPDGPYIPPVGPNFSQQDRVRLLWYIRPLRYRQKAPNKRTPRKNRDEDSPKKSNFDPN